MTTIFQQASIPIQAVQPTIGSTQTKRMNVISLDISLGDYRDVQESIIEAARQGNAGSVCFANVHMVVEAKQRKEVAQAINSATWVAPDGMPLVWAMRLLYGIKQDRITGMDMLPDLLKRAAEESLPVFFYGSTTDVLDRTLKVCQQRFVNLKVAGVYSPPFRPLTANEEDEIIQTIADSEARLVFVALGCPKQEIWLNRMHGRIPAILLAIGGALPVLAGEVSRAPGWMQDNGLEWLYRLSQEPRRLLRRYVVTNSLYIWYLLGQLLIRKSNYVSNTN